MNTKPNLRKGLGTELNERRAARAAILLLLLFLLGPPAVVQAQFTYTTDNGTITITGYTGPGGDVTIPSAIGGLAVTSIGPNAFSYCTSLTSVTIPNSITNIGYRAFDLCTSLTKLTVDTNNPVFSSVDGVLFNKSQTTIVLCPAAEAGTYRIPSSVTSIGDAAFARCISLTSVTIPDGVTNIGNYAFGNCSKLVNFTIPSGVTSIGDSTFYGCSGLTSVTIPEGVTSIGDYAFYGCSGLTSVTIPEGVTSIGAWAFYGCSVLTSVTIPDGVTSIGNVAFRSCSKLTSVTIGKSVASIGIQAFVECISLTAITVDTLNSTFSTVDGVLFDKNQTTLIQCPAGKIGSYTVPSSVTNIGPESFEYCTSLAQVTISSNVASIQWNAFQFCIGLTSVRIPNSVTSIGENAFLGCNKLTTVTIGDSVTSIESRAFWHCDSLLGVYFQGNAPSIGGEVFGEDYNATVYYLPDATGWGTTFGGLPAVLWDPKVPYTYTIDNDTITIKAYTGSGGAVTIPSAIGGLAVTSIGRAAFEHYTSLTSIMIPDSVTSIGEDAFDGCASLANVTIPSSVTNIGAGAFRDCTGLTTIAADALNSAYSSVDGVLFNKRRTTLIQYPGGKAGAYAIPSGVTSIGDSTFYGCSGLTSVTIPDGVTSIGDYAFYGCSGLTSVTIPEGVTSIGAWAFYGCSVLTSVTIPDGVTGIGDGMFYECTSLTNFIIPDSVSSFGDRAFENCASLTSVTISDSVTSIGNWAFYGCTSLTAFTVDALNSTYSSMDGVLFNDRQTTLIQYPGGKAGGYTIPATVTSIGNEAFRNCPKLASVTIGSSVVSIGIYAFTECLSLTAITVDALNSAYTSVDGVLFNKSQTKLIQYPEGKVGSYAIPAGITSIGDLAFCGCTGLTGVSIPDSVTNILSSAFESCAGLTSVTIPNRVNLIDAWAFRYCTSLTNVTIGVGLYYIGEGAFAHCPSLLAVHFQGGIPTFSAAIFEAGDGATVYYLPGTTGWGASFCGRPTALWRPRAETGDASFGVRTNQFGFTITWASGMTVVVEACTNVANPTWSPISTNTLTGGSSYFSDPQWTNYPARFYRIRSL